MAAFGTPPASTLPAEVEVEVTSPLNSWNTLAVKYGCPAMPDCWNVVPTGRLARPRMLSMSSTVTLPPANVPPMLDSPDTLSGSTLTRDHTTPPDGSMNQLLPSGMLYPALPVTENPVASKRWSLR